MVASPSHSLLNQLHLRQQMLQRIRYPQDRARQDLVLEPHLSLVISQHRDRHEGSKWGGTLQLQAQILTHWDHDPTDQSLPHFQIGSPTACRVGPTSNYQPTSRQTGLSRCATVGRLGRLPLGIPGTLAIRGTSETPESGISESRVRQQSPAIRHAWRGLGISLVPIAVRQTIVALVIREMLELLENPPVIRTQTGHRDQSHQEDQKHRSGRPAYPGNGQARHRMVARTKAQGREMPLQVRPRQLRRLNQISPGL